MKVFSKQQGNLSTCEYINLADIRGQFLYTKDNKVYQFIKAMPIPTALMTPDEKARLTMVMARELSPIGMPFKILFISRPTDIKQIIEYYDSIRSMTVDSKKRDNLKKTMNYLSKMATTGGVLERQTFIALWAEKDEKGEDELYSKTVEFRNALTNAGVSATICNETEIANMIGLFYKPVFAQVDINTTPNYTFMGGGV